MVQITAILKSNGKSVKIAIVVRRALGAAQNVTRQSVASGRKVEQGDFHTYNARTHDSHSSSISL